MVRPLIVVVAMVALAGGCAARPKLLPSPPPPTSQTTNKPSEVQQAVMVFVDRFIPAMAEACDYIEHNAKTPQARAAAQSHKIGGALAAMKNAVNPNPYAGLLDMVVMVTLLSDTAEKPPSQQLYGADNARLVAALSAQKNEVWKVAARFVTDAQLQELRQSINDWETAHPNLTYVAFVRIDDFPETRQINKDDARKRPNSVFGLLFLDPLSNLDPAVREFELSRQLIERAFFYLQRMPLVISWQTDQMFTQMLSAPEIQTTVSATTEVADSTTRFAKATADFASSIERFRGDVPSLQRDAIDQAGQVVARQRDEAIRQATTQISAERDAAVRQVASVFRVEQQETAQSLQQVLKSEIDHLYRRAAQLIGLALLAALIFLLAARKFRSKRVNEIPTELTLQRP